MHNMSELRAYRRGAGKSYETFELFYFLDLHDHHVACALTVVLVACPCPCGFSFQDCGTLWCEPERCDVSCFASTESLICYCEGRPLPRLASSRRQSFATPDGASACVTSRLSTQTRQSSHVTRICYLQLSAFVASASALRSCVLPSFHASIPLHSAPGCRTSSLSSTLP